MGNSLFSNGEEWRGEIINKKFHRMRLKYHAEDNQEYRDGYPKKVDDPQLNDNYLFYTNQIPSRPDGEYIENILRDWWGDYEKLETHHGYIQWLFPIRDKGMNIESQILQGHEAKAIQNDPVAKDRVLKAYEMMLDFYGLKIVSMKRGALDRADHWNERSSLLITSWHNYLRITRILKSLGELGWEHLKFGLVNFLFEEIMVKRTIPDAIESLHDYWIDTLRDNTHRRVMFTRFTNLVKNYPELYAKKKTAKQK